MSEVHKYDQFATGLYPSQFLDPRDKMGYFPDLKTGKVC